MSAIDATMPSARAAAVLRRLARREDLKAAVLATPALYTVLLRAALRYVAGESRDDAIAKARALATARGAEGGHRATIDFMGEDTREAAAARAATDEFRALGPFAADGQLAATCGSRAPGLRASSTPARGGVRQRDGSARASVCSRS